jgi:hypothetical protein
MQHINATLETVLMSVRKVYKISRQIAVILCIRIRIQGMRSGFVSISPKCKVKLFLRKNFNLL